MTAPLHVDPADVPAPVTATAIRRADTFTSKFLNSFPGRLKRPKPQHQVRLIDTPPSTSSAPPVMNEEALEAM